MSESLADNAHIYSQFGWALVPLEGKSPVGYGWQRSLPMPPDTAHEIWQGRDCNMGLVLGSSGVIDYEMDAGTLEDFLAPFGGEIPDTPVYRTGSGKLHILFKDPGGLSRTTRGGFELRAGPHQSVIPPSVHPDTGKPYEWEKHPADYRLLDPPKALLDFFSPRVAKGERGESHWSSPLREHRKLGPGEGRHASMISFLGRMVNVLSSPEELSAAGITYAELTQDPPYTDEEIIIQANRVWDLYREEQELAELDGADSYLGIRTLDKVSMRSVEFLWKPFLQRSAFHLLVGRKGAGKGSLLSWLAAQMTTGQLEGHDARTVLWISTEDSFEIDVKPRFIAQGGDPRMFLTANKRVRLPEDLDKIESVCREHGVGMLVVDPIVGVIGSANTNDEGPIVAAIGGLNALADRLDLMVVGVRHLGKRIEGGILEAVLGSAAWVNTPRVVLGIAQEEDSKTVTLQVLAGNRSGARSSFDFRLEEAMVEGLEEPVSKIVPVGNTLTDVSEILSRAPRDKKFQATRAYLLELIEDGTPVTKEGVFPMVKEATGASVSTLDNVVTELRKEGLIRFVSRASPNEPWYFVRAAV